jgi:hypothetical protein
MTKLEILEETFEFYNEHPERRGIAATGDCMYLDDATGNKCAVGRCMLPAAAESLCGVLAEVHELRALLPAPYQSVESIDAALEERYRGHGPDFWAALQTWHDEPTYWKDSVEATGKRQRAMEKLKTAWADN